MSQSLFADLKRIGIDEELAARVSASLDPDYNASKKDVLIMQEAMLQLQVRTDKRYYELQASTDKRYYELQASTDKRYFELKTEMVEGFANIRSEMSSMHRQYWITFGGLITTIVSIFFVNWYFHL